MANVNITDMTYGRSDIGRATLLSNLKGDLNNAKAAFGQLTEVNNTVRKYWSGTDADKFLAQLKSKADAAAKKCDSYKSIVETALASDDKKFRAMQDKIKF